MGWSIDPIGLRHKVETSSIEAIAGFLMDAFNADVRCFRVSREEGAADTECGTFTREGTEHEITVYEDRTGYMGSRDSWELLFDWNPFPCRVEEPDYESYVEIFLYEDIVDMYLVDAPFRWYDFIKNFTEHDDREYDSLRRADLDGYRRSIMEYSRVFGCEKIMYVADQGVGDYIVYHTENMDAKTLTEYVERQDYLREDKAYFRERSIVVDIPEFLTGGCPLLKQGKDEGYLDVLYDDFRDLRVQL